MAEKRMTLDYQDDDLHVALVVSRATALMGMERSIKIFTAIDAFKKEQAEGQVVNPALATLRRYTYPDLVSCTSEVTGIPWPLSLEQFLALPDDLISKWETQVYAVNPHWYLAIEGEPEVQKKETPSESISVPTSRTTRKRHRPTTPSPSSAEPKPT